MIVMNTNATQSLILTTISCSAMDFFGYHVQTVCSLVFSNIDFQKFLPVLNLSSCIFIYSYHVLVSSMVTFFINSNETLPPSGFGHIY